MAFAVKEYLWITIVHRRKTNAAILCWWFGSKPIKSL